MSQTYNHIRFFGNENLELTLIEIERRFEEFKNANPNSFSRASIGRIFYGLNTLEFNSASWIDDVTKSLCVGYFSHHESEFISGFLIPTDFQDYLTSALAKVDPCVIAINEFNTTDDDYGYYISLCTEAKNGVYEVTSEFASTSNNSRLKIETERKRSLQALYKKAPWFNQLLAI